MTSTLPEIKRQLIIDLDLVLGLSQRLIRINPIVHFSDLVRWARSQVSREICQLDKGKTTVVLPH